MRQALPLLLAAALALPMVTLVLLGVARLLAAMQDPAGAAVLDRVALAGGIMWLVDLVLLIIVLATQAAGWQEPPRPPPDELP